MGTADVTTLIKNIRADLVWIEEKLAENDCVRALDSVDSLRAGVQGLHLAVWHRHHVSGTGGKKHGT